MAKETTTKEIIKHKFENGLEVSGTFEQLEAVAKSMGLKLTGIKSCPSGYYPSASKGLVKISDMNDYHIRRALLKRSKDYFAEVYNREDTNEVFLKKFVNLTSDQVIIDFVNELSKR